MSKNRKLQPFVITAVLLASLAGAAGAHAEGLYVGGALGAPDYSRPINGYGTGESGRGPAFKLYGGYQLNENFSLEGQVFHLGRSVPTDGQARVYGFGLDAVGSLPVAQHWALQGSLGMAHARLNTPTGDDTSPAVKAGLGVQYTLNEHTALRLGYDRYHFTDAFDAKPDVGATFLGVHMNY